MTKGIVFLLIVLIGGSAFVHVISVGGWGIPRPSKKPVSIREGSVRGVGTTGTRYPRTRYFSGGGMRGGK